MVVRDAWIPSHGTYSVDTTNDVYNPHAGKVSFETVEPRLQELDAEQNEKVQAIVPVDHIASATSLHGYLNIAALANLASLEQTYDDEKGSEEWTAQGAPTEIAIEVFASRFGWGRAALTQGPKTKWTHVTEFPFDSDVKKMSVLYNDTSSKTHIFTKVRLLNHFPLNRLS